MTTQSSALPVRAMMFLLKVFVPVLALFLLLNFVYTPSCARFSCGYEPYWLLQAEADSGECPEALGDAWSNAGWAAERWAEIKDDDKTAGLYYDAHGEPRKIRSGVLKGADTERARQVLRQVGAAAAKDGSYPAAHHVEVKIAARMREDGAKAALVVINHPDGPCPGRGAGLSCQEVLPLVLATGSTLRVWWQEGGVMRFQDFTGR